VPDPFGWAFLYILENSLMLIKLVDPSSGIISTDSTLKSVYMLRNNVNFYFPIPSTDPIEIILFTIEDIANLNFQIDAKASVVVNGIASSITVTAENGDQTVYQYNLSQTTPYAGKFPLVNGIAANGVDGLVGQQAKEGHDIYSITIVDLIVNSNYQTVVFSGDVFPEFQDVASINGNIPVGLATSLMSTGFAYYIVGWGDGIGGSDWVSYPDFNVNFLFYRVVEDSSQFGTEVVSVINPSELVDLYALMSTDIVIPLPNQATFDTAVGVIQSEFESFTDSATLQTALGNAGIDFDVIGVDVLAADIESVVIDLSVEEAIALNVAQSLTIFSLDDLYSLSITIATQLLSTPVTTAYPFLRQYCQQILDADVGYSPTYIERTLTLMKTEVFDEVVVLFTDPKFWLSTEGLGFINTKFIYDRYKFVLENYQLFDFSISKDSVEDIVIALNDLLNHYYTYGNSDGTALLPETIVLLPLFPSVWAQSSNQSLPIN